MTLREDHEYDEPYYLLAARDATGVYHSVRMDTLLQDVTNLQRTSYQIHAETAFLPYTINSFYLSTNELEKFMKKAPLVVLMAIQTLVIRIGWSFYIEEWLTRLNALKDVPQLKKIVMLYLRKSTRGPRETIENAKQVKKVINAYTGRRDIEVVGEYDIKYHY